MKTGRKITGGKYIKQRKKKAYERAGQKKIVKLGEEKRKTVRTMGGNKKTFLLKAQNINLKIGKEIKKTLVKKVLETPSNRFLARQNIITKGTIFPVRIIRIVHQRN